MMLRPGRLQPDVSHGADAAPGLTTEARDSSASPSPIDRQRELRAAETRLLYENGNTGTVVTVVIAGLIAYANRDPGSRVIAVVWLVYMLFVTGARIALSRRYSRTQTVNSDRWNSAFVAGVALAAAGWCAGAVLLYEPGGGMREMLVVFAIGGVMLGGASILAARPEAFLTFLVPTGLLTSLRIAIEGDESHLTMGFLGAVFTVATTLTAWRFHQSIESSLMLRFHNQDLIASLQSAKDQAEALNRELESRVRDRTAKLMEEDQRKDEFLATLAHELRNPLAPIRFAVETMKDESFRSTTAHAREVIERQLAQLVRLVDDLLDVSRITANKIRLRREPLDLGSLMTTAVESITPLASAAGQRVEVRLPAAPTGVNADGARLVQVFANILNNAVKFTPRGGHILFSAEGRPGAVTIRIRDTGVGISNDVLPRVFDMFHQAEPALERSTGGLGIGLTLARRLVEMHDGQIAIKSAGPGQGTEVEIRLPTTAAAGPTAAPQHQAHPAAVRTLRVLIVEDNLDAAEMLELVVSHLGHATRLAHDGAAALTAAAEFAPDVIFLDIGLPVMNGYAVAQSLRSKPQFQDVHIAAVTGWGQDEDRRKAREAGCDSHFTKPLSPDALEGLLANLSRPAEGHGAAPSQRTRLADSGSTG